MQIFVILVHIYQAYERPSTRISFEKAQAMVVNDIYSNALGQSGAGKSCG
jgi:hypothetical protein